MTVLQDKLAVLRNELNQFFLEREDVVTGVLTAIINKTNGFLGGPPGTGKSLLVKTVAESFDSTYFYYLVNATTTPDELLGALDLLALQQGVFRRDLSRGLANANIAVLDEVFKANSPCLNAMLGILLDKEIMNGGAMVSCPLNSMLGCSNELPQDSSLAPFWDRLVLRYWVKDVSHKARLELMLREVGQKPIPSIQTKFSQKELLQMQVESASVNIPSTLLEIINKIISELESEGLGISTRKSNQVVRLLRCYAYVLGEQDVTEDHLDVLEHILWNQLNDKALIRQCLKKYANPNLAKAHEYLALAEQAILELSSDGDIIKSGMVIASQVDEQIKMIDHLLAEGPSQKIQDIKKMIQDIKKDILSKISTKLGLPN